MICCLFARCFLSFCVLPFVCLLFSCSLVALCCLLFVLGMFAWCFLFLVVLTCCSVFGVFVFFAFCIFVAWIWRRNDILIEIKQGCPDAESGLFWKIWPFYVKFICPVAILAVYFQ